MGINKITNFLEEYGVSLEFLKFSIPIFILSALKSGYLLRDEGVSKTSVFISFLTGSVLSIVTCYPLSEEVSTITLIILVSVVTFSGENIMKALIQKNDWDKVINSLINALIEGFKKQFKNGK